MSVFTSQVVTTPNVATKERPQTNILELFLAHQQKLHAYFYARLRNREASADLVQETFLRFTKKKYDSYGSCAVAYLYRIASNLVIDHVRRDRRRRTECVAPDCLTDISDDTQEPPEIVDACEQIQRLQRAVQDLPERTRRVLILYRLKEFTYSEVAARLAISESSVQKHLAKALEQVRQHVGPG